jgi:hypothetical protein
MSTLEMSKPYRDKVEACKASIRLLDATPSALVNHYVGQCFPETEIQKSDLFKQVLDCSILAATAEYLARACDLPRFRDRRTPVEYGIDLVLGWLVEDAVLRFFESHDRTAVLSGHDRYREFLPPRKISTQPDIRLGQDPGKLIEIFCDWKGTWRKHNHADLRDSKFNKLRSEEALMIGIAPLTHEGFVIDFGSETGGFESSFIPAYQKPGYTTHDIRDKLRPLDQALTEALKTVDSI